jgi:hypothetical protein
VLSYVVSELISIQVYFESSKNGVLIRELYWKGPVYILLNRTLNQRRLEAMSLRRSKPYSRSYSFRTIFGLNWLWL